MIINRETLKDMIAALPIEKQIELRDYVIKLHEEWQEEKNRP